VRFLPNSQRVELGLPGGPIDNPDFVWHMGDVLAVDERPPDPPRPVVCLDETSRQLLADARPPEPPAPGRPARQDPEDVRVSDLLTRLDRARCVKDLVDIHYRDAKRIALVMDHLNTHSPASLYAAIPPPEAARLAAKLESHHSPEHGSWLNMAEIELGVSERQCPRRRHDRLAGHHRRRARQTAPALPGKRALTP
jgi:hypothetical protein